MLTRKIGNVTQTRVDDVKQAQVDDVELMTWEVDVEKPKHRLM